MGREISHFSFLTSYLLQKNKNAARKCPAAFLKKTEKRNYLFFLLAAFLFGAFFEAEREEAFARFAGRLALDAFFFLAGMVYLQFECLIKQRMAERPSGRWVL